MPYNPNTQPASLTRANEEEWVDADEEEDHHILCIVCNGPIASDECLVRAEEGGNYAHAGVCCGCYSCPDCLAHIYGGKLMRHYVTYCTARYYDGVSVASTLGLSFFPTDGDHHTITQWMEAGLISPDKLVCRNCCHTRIDRQELDPVTYEEHPADETVVKPAWRNRTGNQVMRWVFRDDFTFLQGDDCAEMPGDVFIGVELECEHGGSRKLQQEVERWHSVLQSDGSVSSGFEIATAPASGDKFVEMIHCLTDAAKSAHGLITQRCGLHVHIDCRDLTPGQILLMTGLWSAFEHQFIAMMPPSRRGQNQSTRTHYCRPISPRWRAMQALSKGTETVGQRLGFMIRRKFELTPYNRGERYRAWNLTSLTKYNTIECRLHSGTLQPNKIIPWASILASLKRAVVNLSSDELAAHLAQPKTSRELLQELVYSESARRYVVDRQHTFREWNSPEQLVTLLNPIHEYKEALQGRAA